MSLISITLTQGAVALVDESDIEIVSARKWRLQKCGRRWAYAVADIRGRVVGMHRLITNCPVGMVVDHIDGNGLNNVRTNLRIATASQNIRSQRVQQVSKTSKFKGVYWDKKQLAWIARIGIGGQRIPLGSFDAEDDAARAYDAAAMLHFGQFALCNLTPLPDTRSTAMSAVR